MEYITLYNGIKMPLLGLGTWDLRGQECIDTVCCTIKNGYKLIDTAQMYENEREVGEGILKSRISRDKLFVTTKIYGNNSYQKTKEAIEKSLKNLKTNYIDLLLLHEPYLQEKDMYKALEEAYNEGKVKAIGISNYDEKRLTRFIKQCHVIPAINQIECHVYYQKHRFQKILDDHHIKMQAWAPLAQAKINISQESILLEIANKYKKTPSQIALRFLVQRGISVIPKSKREERLVENINIFDFSLTNDEMEKIKKIDRNETLFSWTKCF